MSDIEMLTIKTRLDETGFDDLEKRAAKSLSLLKQRIDQFNRSSAVTADTDALQNELKELEKQLDELVGDHTLQITPDLDALMADLDKAIRRARELKDELASAGGNAARELEVSASQTVARCGSQLTSMANNLNTFFSANAQARIQSLDKELERELRLIDTALQREMLMYEAQCEQFADLDERMAGLKEDHAERLEDINWKMREHITEEEWRVFEEQRLAEEERYAASMADLETDALYRDEIRARQEQAETEALARKEAREKEYAVKRAKLERKQAESNKMTSLFTASINVAEGITKAWGQGGGLFGAVLAALVAAAGAIQLASIAAQPLPEIPSFHSGGTIGPANIGRYASLPGPDNPYDKTLFWGQQGEQVLPLREAEAYRAMKAAGFSLAEGLERLAWTGQAASAGSSTVITQKNIIQARNELTFAEARRLAAKQNRALVRALA